MTRPLEGIRPSDPISRIMRGPVVATVASDASIKEVAEELTADEIGAVLVTGPRGPEGVISERDIMTLLGTGEDLDSRQAADLMSPDIEWATPDDTIQDVAARMRRGGIRHVPVRNREGQVVGMVSVRDFLAVIAG